jgi:hypothetical protein
MKHTVEMGSGAMIYSYIQSFVRNRSDIQKLNVEIHRHTDSMVIS